MEVNDITNHYIVELKELDGRLTTLLDEFTKIYVMAKMNPTNQEYHQQLEMLFQGIEEVTSKAYSISNEIQQHIENINQQLKKLYESINKERRENKKLRKKLGMVEEESNASIELIGDYQHIYENKYLRNWALVISTGICVLAIKHTYI